MTIRRHDGSQMNILLLGQVAVGFQAVSIDSQNSIEY
jgi:hypothetical protein